MKPLAPRLHAAPRWLFWLLLLSGALLLGLCILFPVLGVLEWVAAVPSGVVAFDGKEYCFSEKVEDESLVSMRNVAGEIKGAECAMRFALEHGCKEVYIYHDYEGIAKWCLGEWKTNKEGTKAYKAFFDSIQEKIQIYFVKVKGHSDDYYNDLADSLAKKALGIG